MTREKLAGHAKLLWVEDVLYWFDHEQRDLPWRGGKTSPWGVYVSEVMLQQTPVVRVLPVWTEWMRRWPRPSDLAKAPLAEVITAWGRLGYPRRAKRLREAAAVIATEHGDEVPSDHDALLALPGVGEYTAAAVRAFAFELPAVVVDTNVRRVYARAVQGKELPDRSYSAAERALATAIEAHVSDEESPAWAAATMELGALICTARTPSCTVCPIETSCAWQLAGCPPHEGPRPKGQAYEGTDRYVRGLVLQLVKDAQTAVPWTTVASAWADAAQLDRAVSTLIDDGLLDGSVGGQVQLPA